MILTEIYKQYQIPPNLAHHMLLVGAVGEKIINSWTGPKIRSEILMATLLTHDLGNIVKFDLDSDLSKKIWLKYNQEPDWEHWRQVQAKFRKKYSANAEQANIAILKELGLPQAMIKLMSTHSFEKLPDLLEKQAWEDLICLYADLRISPHGLISIEARIADLKKRYQQDDSSWADGEVYQQRQAVCQKLESDLNQRTKLDLAKLKPKDLDPGVRQLADFSFSKLDN